MIESERVNGNFDVEADDDNDDFLSMTMMKMIFLASNMAHHQK